MAVCVQLAACDTTQNEYATTYECRFSYDTMLHNTGVLWAAVQAGNFGQWTLVRTDVRGGVRYVFAQLAAGGKEEQTAITTERETRQSYILGAYNGLIIGQSMLNGGQLYAYDRQCPNCLTQYGLYKYSLQPVAGGTKVQCPQCHRTYQLDNGGFPDTDGMKLLRYRAVYNGQVLVVNN